MNAQRLVGTLAALVLGAGLIGAALPDGSSGSTKARGPDLRFTLVGQIDSAHVVDHDGDGISAGDVLVFSERLFDETGEKPRGSTRATCTRLSDPSGDYLCEGVFQLRRGQITVQGVDSAENITRDSLVVTGGSGRYRGVRGEIDVHRMSPNQDRFEFRLSR